MATTYGLPVHTLTVSAKRLVTVPKDIAEQLDIHEGDELIAYVSRGRIVMKKKPENPIEAMEGSAAYLYGRTREEQDEYVRKERDSWER